MRDPTVVTRLSTEVPSAIDAICLSDAAQTHFDATIVRDAFLIELLSPTGAAFKNTLTSITNRK